MKSPLLSDKAASGEVHLKFSIASGFFQQDEATGHDNKRLGTVYQFPENFGLKSITYDTDAALRVTIDNPTDWQRFDYKLKQMNKIAADHDTEYVVLYAARHGQGYHNIAEEKVGTYNWENPSNLSETPICFLPQFEDAHLTPVGKDQADMISHIMSSLIQNQHLPAPTAYYTSPLHRACSTSLRTWSSIHQSTNLPTPYSPVIHELLREQMYPHNCNKRSPIWKIKSSFPKFTLENDSFGVPPELDNLFSSSHREQDEQVTDRASIALSDILLRHISIPNPLSPDDIDNISTVTKNDNKTQKQNQYISLTSHAGFLSGLLRSLGLPQSSIPRFPTGIIFPLLIKVELKPGPRPLPEWSYLDRQPRLSSIHSEAVSHTEIEIESKAEKETSNSKLPTQKQKDHAAHAKDLELKGKTLKQILREIFDDDVYEGIREETRLGKWT